jgi:hypothetical protein
MLNRVGPLFDLRGNLKPGVALGVETNFNEWFAERLAWANQKWAEGRIEPDAVPGADAGLIEVLAYEFRQLLKTLARTVNEAFTRDEMLRGFREFLDQGERWQQGGIDFVERDGLGSEDDSSGITQSGGVQGTPSILSQDSGLPGADLVKGRRAEAESLAGQQRKVLLSQELAAYLRTATAVYKPKSSEVSQIAEWPEKIVKILHPADALSVGKLIDHYGRGIHIDSAPKGMSEVDLVERILILNQFNSFTPTKILGWDEAGQLVIEQPMADLNQQDVALDNLLSSKRAVRVSARDSELHPQANFGSFVVQAKDQQFYFVQDLRKQNVGVVNGEALAFDLLVKELSEAELKIPTVAHAVQTIQTDLQDHIEFVSRPTPGDEKVEIQPVQRVAKDLKKAREILDSLTNQPLINQRTGLVSTISKNTAGKMTSQSAAQKSASVKIHALALANIDQLYQAAIPGEIKPDRDGDINIKSVRRFYAPLGFLGQTYTVKITVKELVPKDQGNRIYSLETVEIETPAEKRKEGAEIEDLRVPQTNNAGASIRVDELIPNYNIEFSERSSQDVLQKLKERIAAREQWLANIRKDINAQTGRNRELNPKRALADLKANEKELLVELAHLRAQRDDLVLHPKAALNAETASVGVQQQAALERGYSAKFRKAMGMTYASEFIPKLLDKAKGTITGFLDALPELPVFGKSVAGQPASYFALFREGYRQLKGAGQAVQKDAEIALRHILEPINQTGVRNDSSAYNVFRRGGRTAF